MFNKVHTVFLVNRRSSLSHVFMGILGIFFLVQTGLSQQEFDGDKDFLTGPGEFIYEGSVTLRSASS